MSPFITPRSLALFHMESSSPFLKSWFHQVSPSNQWLSSIFVILRSLPMFCNASGWMASPSAGLVTTEGTWAKTIHLRKMAVSDGESTENGAQKKWTPLGYPCHGSGGFSGCCCLTLNQANHCDEHRTRTKQPATYRKAIAPIVFDWWFLNVVVSLGGLRWVVSSLKKKWNGSPSEVSLL